MSPQNLVTNMVRIMVYNKVMFQVNIAEAKAQLSALIARATAGEEVVLCRHNKPLVRLVPIEPKPQKRVWGQKVMGEVWVSDDFDAPLTDEELAEWERPIQ